MEILYSMAMVMFITGSFILILPPVMEDIKMFHTGMPVMAWIHEKKEKKYFGKTYAYITWRYKYEGKEYFHYFKHGITNECRKVGESGALMLNRKNPSKVYRFMTIQQKFISRIAGILLIIVAIIMFIMLVHMRNEVVLLVTSCII